MIRLIELVDLDQIDILLKYVEINYKYRDNILIRDSLEFLKQYAVINHDYKSAKKIWCLEQIFNIQKGYVDAFFDIKRCDFYEGWCLLEDVEGCYINLNRHFDNNNDNYKIRFIFEHVKKIQSVFPYNLFLSPGLIVDKFKCNICGKTYKLRKKCEHEVGEIYDGRLCVKLADGVNLLECSIVKSPVQKYSVFFNEGEDNYNYFLVYEIISNLQSPFHLWNYTISEKLQPHSNFKHLSENDYCPCGSGEKYKNCCLNKKGVLGLHYQISYSVKPKDKIEEKFLTKKKSNSLKRDTALMKAFKE